MYQYHSTVYPSTKNKKFSRWTFTSITHVSYNQLHLLYQERKPHSTSTWKALVNFTFVSNGLYYMYPHSKLLHNALWWRSLFTPHCMNTSITKGKNSPSCGIQEVDYMEFQLNNREKIYHSDDQRGNILYFSFLQPSGYMPQTRTKKKTNNKKLQTTAHHWGIYIPFFIL